MPVGKDGILLNNLNPNEDVYVYSNIKYNIPYTKKINFDQNDIEEDKFKYVDKDTKEEKIDELGYKQALIADLKKQAQEYIIKNSVPKVNYQIKSDVQGVTDIGDIIKVYYKTLGIEILTNVISYEYDCILKKYIFLEFGNFRKTIKDIFSNLNSNFFSALKESNEEIKTNLSEKINTLFMDENEDLKNVSVSVANNQILILDNTPIEEAQDVIKLDNQGIGHSDTGVNGEFKNIISIDGTLNTKNIPNFESAVKESQNKTLHVGSLQNKKGIIKVYNNNDEVMIQINNEGITVVRKDGLQILFNNEVGMQILNSVGQTMLSVNNNEITCNNLNIKNNFSIFGLRAKKIKIRDAQGNVLTDGIGLY